MQYQILDRLLFRTRPGSPVPPSDPETRVGQQVTLRPLPDPERHGSLGSAATGVSRR